MNIDSKIRDILDGVGFETPELDKRTDLTIGAYGEIKDDMQRDWVVSQLKQLINEFGEKIISKSDKLPDSVGVERARVLFRNELRSEMRERKEKLLNEL